MGLMDSLLGTPGRIENVPTMSGEQSQLFAQLLQGLGGQGGQGGPLQAGLGNLMGLLSGDQSALEAFQAPAIRQFEEQTVPGIAERFSSMGAGAQGSSAFGQQLGAAGAGLAENLSAQRSGLQSQALSQLSSLLGLGVQTPTFQSMQIPGQEGGLSKLFGGLGTGLGLAGGAALPGGLAKFGGILKTLLGGGGAAAAAGGGV